MEYVRASRNGPVTHRSVENLRPPAEKETLATNGRKSAKKRKRNDEEGEGMEGEVDYDALDRDGDEDLMDLELADVQALGEDGLNFLGYSYGTILGATFAAIRPNLVKRMVLDGVSDAEAYFNDVLQWGRSGMRDTHKASPILLYLGKGV